jgi:hypothetical protein
LLKNVKLMNLMNNLRMTLTYLVLEHSWRSFHEHLLLENCLCLGDYMYPQLHMKIPLLGDTLMRGQFPNIAFFNKQIVNIFWSQIETWQVFNLAKVLTSFTTAYKLRTLIESSMWCRISLMIDTLIARRRKMWKNAWKWKHLWQMTTMIWLKKWNTSKGWI